MKTRYVRIDAASVVEVDHFQDIEGRFHPSLRWIESDTAQIGDVYDEEAGTFAAPAYLQADPLAVQAEAAAAVQRLLDSAAQAHGYDSIISLCTYATSSNAKWRAEGQYGCDLRDACWGKAEEIQSAVIAGDWPTPGAGLLPTVAEVLAEMPPVEWPVWPPAAPA